MSITLKLPADLEEALVADATERGVPVEDMAAHAVQIFVSYSSPVEKSIRRADRVKGSYISGTSIPAPHDEDKISAVLDLLAILRDGDKVESEYDYKMGVLHAAVALWDVSSESRPLPLTLRLHELFEKNSSERLFDKTDKERFAAPPRPKTRSFGLLKGRLSSSDEFLADKHTEAQREREKDEARGYPKADA